MTTASLARLWELCDMHDAQQKIRNRASWAYYCYIHKIFSRPAYGSWEYTEEEKKIIELWDSKLEEEFQKEKEEKNIVYVGCAFVAYDEKNAPRHTYVPKGTPIKSIYEGVN